MIEQTATSREAPALASPMELNLGSGNKYDADAMNPDVTPDTDPDVVHNLNQLPWLFPDDRFDEVSMRDVLEHLDDTLAIMEEVHRVCRPDALVQIVLPHFSSNGASRTSRTNDSAPW